MTAPDNTPATVDLASEERGAGSAPTENSAHADADGRQPVAAGRHGIFHRRDH